jgi:hypothetical protein
VRNRTGNKEARRSQGKRFFGQSFFPPRRAADLKRTRPAAASQKWGFPRGALAVFIHGFYAEDPHHL